MSISSTIELINPVHGLVQEYVHASVHETDDEVHIHKHPLDEPEPVIGLETVLETKSKLEVPLIPVQVPEITVHEDTVQDGNVLDGSEHQTLERELDKDVNENTVKDKVVRSEETKKVIKEGRTDKDVIKGEMDKFFREEMTIGNGREGGRDKALRGGGRDEVESEAGTRTAGSTTAR